MRVRITPQKRKPQRNGFTLIELLVVISIIAVLASLVLPGVQQARETARRTQCLNNMRNIGVAMQTYATERRGALPPLYGRDMVQNDSGSDWGPASWAVHILPYVEQRGLYDRLTDSSVRAGQLLSDLATTNIEIYTCPDDPNDGNDGAMSFVVNAGYTTHDRWLGAVASHRIGNYAYPGGSDASMQANIAAASGVFFPERAPVAGTSPQQELLLSTAGFKPSLDKVINGDGLSQTIFITENLDTPDFTNSGGGLSIPTVQADGTTGTFTTGLGQGGFIGYRLGDSGFALSLAGTAGVPTSTGAAPQSALAFATNPFAAPDQQDSRINENLGVANSGASPRPSSLHPGTVNVIFGDGSGRNISENIDGGVYTRLISSNGNRFGQNILSSDDY